MVKEHAVNDGTLISVINHWRSIDVTPTPQRNVVIDGTKRGPERESEILDDLTLETETTDETLVARTPYPHNQPASIDLDVGIPDNAIGARFETVYGDVTATDIPGDLSLQCSTGILEGELNGDGPQITIILNSVPSKLLTRPLVKIEDSPHSIFVPGSEISVESGINEIDLDMSLEPGEYLLTRDGSFPLRRGEWSGWESQSRDGLALIGGSKPGDYSTNRFWYYFFDLHVAANADAHL